VFSAISDVIAYCTNASRGLSATAELLVSNNKLIGLPQQSTAILIHRLIDQQDCSITTEI